MKRILILTYFFPPANFAGSYRMESFAKYLHEYGYFPVIVTRHWSREISTYRELSASSGTDVVHKKHPHYEVYSVPYRSSLRDRIHLKYGDRSRILTRKFLSSLEWLSSFFTSRFVSFGNLQRFAESLIRDDHFSLLIASASPYILFRFARDIHKKTGIPWVADYRDEWTEKPYRKNNSFSAQMKMPFESILEKRWVGTASAVISVSEVLTQRISALVKKKGYVVMNGFDEDLYESIPARISSNQFTIVYNGTLYPGQKAEVFLDALKRVIREEKGSLKIKILFAGTAVNPAQAQRIRECMKGFESYYEVTERIPKNEIISIQKGAELLLLSGYPELKGIFSSKIFEYLACGRPVLLCPSDNDVMERLIRQTSSGYITNTVDEAYELLKKLTQEYFTKGRQHHSGNRNEIEQYSFRKQVGVLSAALDEVIADNETIGPCHVKTKSRS